MALDEGVALRPVADVAGDRQGPTAERLDLRRHLPARLELAAGHDDVGPGFGEAERHGPTQTLAPTGDDHDLAVAAKRRIGHRGLTALGPSGGEQVGELGLGGRAPARDVLGRPALDRLVALEHVAGHHGLVDLVGTVADRPEPGRSIPGLERKVARVAEGATDLDGPVEHVEHDLRHVGFDH